MRIWIDDIRPAPRGFVWVKSVNEAIKLIKHMRAYDKIHNGNKECFKIELISIDHDAGDYVEDGGDYINILNWLEIKDWSYPIHIHTANPVGRDNMRAIIQKNNWKEVF